MITDSHCHLASERFLPEERGSIVARALEAGVDRMVTLATTLDDIAANLSLAGHPSVHACVGIHPCHVHEVPGDAVERLRPFLEDPRVCAVGETGLDYYHPAPEGWSEEEYRSRQRVFLERHFQLARSVGLGVVIHTRDREGDASLRDALRIADGFRGRVAAVFHCFAGTPADARTIIGAGGYLSFGGVCTFRNAASVRETLASCPPGSFFLETDSPYLAPEPHRGQRNEPAFARHVAEAAARVRGESIGFLADHSSAAAAGFFRFRIRPD